MTLPSIKEPEKPVYEERGYCFGVGENLFNLETGEVSRKGPDERPSTWKGARRILALPDDAITEYPPRRRSGKIDYAIDGVSVTWHGSKHGEDRQYACNTHLKNDCPHTRRIDRYRKEHGA